MSFLESCRFNPSEPSVTERYFKPKIVPEKNQCVLIHSNRLCLVTIAPDHPILTKQTDIQSVSFQIIGRADRLQNKVSGKHKRGGQKLKGNSPLCVVRCADGSEYMLYSCVNGTLVEVNEKLLSKPNLLQEKPWADGYIAIILPPLP